MAKSSIKKPSNKLINSILSVLLIFVVIFYGGWVYFNQYFMNPENVYWGMISQNLQTGFYEKSFKQADATQIITQNTQMNFKSKIVSRDTVVIETNVGDKKTVVETEAIGTVNADYLRYTKFSGHSQKVPEDVTNVWAVQTKENSDKEPAFLANGLTWSPFMFAYLNSSARNEIIDQLRASNSVNIDYSKTNKNAQLDNKEVYSYDLVINLSKYIPVYKLYLEKIGQADLATQLGDPVEGVNYEATIFVNPVNRQIVKVEANGISEKYFNFNLNNRIEVPKDIKLSIGELQNRFSQ